MAATTILAQCGSMLTPLSNQSPCGPDLGKDPEFHEMRALATAGLGLAAKAPQWDRVFELGQGLLETKSKDLRIASYVALAWLHRDGFVGLVQGLQLLIGLLSAFPVALHPQAKRARLIGRERAMEWYIEQLESWLKQSDGPRLCPDQQAQWVSLCATLTDLPKDSLTHAQAHATHLKRLLRAIPTRRPNPASEPRRHEPAVKPEANPGGAHVPVDGPCESVGLPAIGAMQRKLAAQLRSQDPSNPLSYRLLRQAVWTPLQRLDEARWTAIQLPTPTQRRTLCAHLAHERWPGLLELAEELLAQYPLCLDLQRFTGLALEALPESRAALRVIHSDLRTLLVDHPKLEDATGINDTPLADAATRAWIRQHQVKDPACTAQPTGETADAATWWQGVVSIRDGPTPELLAKVQEALDQAPDRLEYVRRAHRIAVAHLPIPGLSYLLLCIALDTLGVRNDVVLDRELEQACLSSFMQIRKSNAKGQATSPSGSELDRLTLALGRRKLSEALPYVPRN